jgi:aerobic carbon-monoxide dehydrogenase small subunit
LQAKKADGNLPVGKGGLLPLSSQPLNLELTIQAQQFLSLSGASHPSQNASWRGVSCFLGARMKSDGLIEIQCTVNGAPKTVQAFPMERLLDVLRGQLHLTGTKEGCGEGECGACAVFINGQIMNSCLVPVAQVEGASIKTIEGIATADQLHGVQQAFIDYGGAQCGICTPGMVLAAVDLLERNPNPSEADIRRGLAGNLCRCTGYMKIFESVIRAFGKQVNA